MSEDEGFVGRWSRRKRASQPPAAPATPAQPSPAPVPEPETSAVGPAPITEEELAALPRIEDLVPESDIRGFLRPGVPAALRNAAMRRMWMLTPAIRDHRDVAVDYAWDWNAPAGVPGAGRIDTESAVRMARALLEPRADEATPDAPADAKPEQAGTQAEGRTSEAEAAAEKPATPVTEQPPGARRHGGAKPS